MIPCKTYTLLYINTEEEKKEKIGTETLCVWPLIKAIRLCVSVPPYTSKHGQSFFTPGRSRCPTTLASG